MRYFATNRNMHSLGRAVKQHERALRLNLCKGGYYFVDMDNYMKYYLGTVERKEIPADAVVQNSNQDVFEGFLCDNRIKSIVVCVHGFNVELYQAYTWFRILTDTMKSLLGSENQIVTSPAALPQDAADNTLTAFIGFSWPSDGHVYRYRSDQRDAAAAATPFAALLNKLKATGKRVNLLCHSMGNYLACHALAGMLSEQFGKYNAGVDTSRGSDPLIDTYVMIAPDIERRHVTKCDPDNPREDIETEYHGPFYSGLEHLAGRIVNIYSRFDKILRLSDIEKKPRHLFYKVTEAPGDHDRKWEKRLGSAPAPHSAPDNVTSVNATEIADRKIDHSDHIDSRPIVKRVAKELAIMS